MGAFGEIFDLSVSLAKSELASLRLISAVEKGDYAAVKKHLDNGADVNRQDKTGNTALHAAAYSNQPRIATLLLEHRANPRLRDDVGNTPLHRAADGYRDATVLIKLLLDKGASSTVLNHSGDTPLMLSARYGHKENALLLAERSEEIDRPNLKGETALIVAVRSVKKELVKKLLARGADPAQKLRDGRSLSEYARTLGPRAAEMAEMLEQAVAARLKKIEDARRAAEAAEDERQHQAALEKQIMLKNRFKGPWKGPKP